MLRVVVEPRADAALASLTAQAPHSGKSCKASQGTPADEGAEDLYRGWYDVQGCGHCLDYCRWVGGRSGGDPAVRTVYGGSIYWSCALAGQLQTYSKSGALGPVFLFQRCVGMGAPWSAFRPGFSPHNSRSYSIAQGRPATQSSTLGRTCLHEDLCHDASKHYLGSAARAVDGNFSTVNYGQPGGGSCTHTRSEWEPWWRVDLQHVVDVHTVRLWNCQDCSPGVLYNLEVWSGLSPTWGGVGNKQCGTRQGLGRGVSLEQTCNSTSSRYVFAVLRGRTAALTLCEVRVASSYLTGVVSNALSNLTLHPTLSFTAPQLPPSEAQLQLQP